MKNIAEPMERVRKPAVVFILGWGRSGSTLLANALGSLDGFFSAGEIRHLWLSLIDPEHLCSCGEIARKCRLWVDVVEDMGLRMNDRSMFARLEEARHSAVRLRHTSTILKGRSSAALDEYLDALSRLYVSLSRVTRCSVIVDSSKVPSDAAALLRLDDVVPHLVHLVRDPRATAFSWSGRRNRQMTADLPRYSSLKSGLMWSLFHVAARNVLAETRDGQVLRYEDLVQAPRESLSRLCNRFGYGTESFGKGEEGTLSVSSGHMVAGNPQRFRSGTITIRNDETWRSEQPLFARAVVTLLTAPFLGAYGYPLSPGSK